MQLKKIILGFILSMSFAHTWADDTTINLDTTNSTTPDPKTDTQTTITPRPAVILPQDADEVDAAPDDNEFEVTPDK